MWIFIAALNLAITVMCGAFGAHALKSRLSIEQLSWWQTATLYAFVHALGLLAIGILSKQQSLNGLNSAAYSLQIGIILFTGSLYCLALGAPRWFGAITPLGGTAFILGWLILAYRAWQSNI